MPDSHSTEYGVYHFRRTIELPAKPERFLIHVSADNRYRLFVNGRAAAWGPARGDLPHWRYDTIDAAAYLKAGKNVFAAVVWNFGPAAPMAQVALRTGFLLQAESEAGRAVDTGARWKCARNPAYSPIIFDNAQMRGYYVAGPGDRVDARQYPWGWEQRDFDDSQWTAATVVGPAAGRETVDSPSPWMLVERNIPAMEERALPAPALRKSEGVGSGGISSDLAPRIQPNTKATLLFDQTYLTAAYPALTVSGGKDALVRLSYAETLFVPAANGRKYEKGNRNEIDSKEFVGNRDEFVCDGAQRTFRPLWWRTYRYLQLEIETASEPLTLVDLRGTAIGYPFERRARFSGSAEIERLLDVGWRTARLCAHETYMDCPYYEQLQYVGDTRVQCLISLFNSGDARLMRNAIELINDSRDPNGCTMSRYPTRLPQFIPGFSLWWIAMAHDYWRYVDDPAFVRRMLPGVRAVLSFFAAYQKENGSLGPLPWWRYFDWVPEWPRGESPQEADGSSAPYDLLLALAYGWAAELEAALGEPAQAAAYRDRERQLRETAQRIYWDESRRLYADTPRKQKFSVHTNTMAVLAGLVQKDAARELMRRAREAKDLAQPGLFFQFYVHRALIQAGEGDGYLDWLGDWRRMLELGLTTFAETVDRPGEPSRSDCHAWSASPNIEVFRTVLGVDSAAPGFRRVIVRPRLGQLKVLSGTVPHPRGMIEMSIQPEGAVWNISISLPSETAGDFEWRGVSRPLSAGMNRFSM